MVQPLGTSTCLGVLNGAEAKLAGTFTGDADSLASEGTGEAVGASARWAAVEAPHAAAPAISAADNDGEH